MTNTVVGERDWLWRLSLQALLFRYRCLTELPDKPLLITAGTSPKHLSDSEGEVHVQHVSYSDFMTQDISEQSCIIASLCLPTTELLPDLLQRMQQVLQPSGQLFLSYYALDTLSHLTRHIQEQGGPSLQPFCDMHDIADAINQSGFRDVVCDRQVFSMHYQHAEDFKADFHYYAFDSLLNQFARDNAFSDFCVTDWLSSDVQHKAVPFEIAFFYAMQAPKKQQRNDAGEQMVPLSDIQGLKKQH